MEHSLKIFVIGTASLDTLYFSRQTAHTAGGAGLYTALAAQKAGVETGLFAPKPEPMPHPFKVVDERIFWAGPKIFPHAIPRLEIEHRGDGQATLLDASWGGEAELTPAVIPTELQQADIVHIAALSNADRQSEFLQALQSQRGDQAKPRISVGTYAKLAYGTPDKVRALLKSADYFFMNENEAKGLFGSVEQACNGDNTVLFITLDKEGALVIEGDQTTHVVGHPVKELDPTGAGDTFCGATLAGISQGKTPVQAAEFAVKLAASVVSQPGPSALLVD